MASTKREITASASPRIEAGDESRREPDEHREQRAEGGRGEREARAVQEPREQVASEEIGAEQEARIRSDRQAVVRDHLDLAAMHRDAIHDVKPVGRLVERRRADPRREQRREHDHAQHHERGHARAVAPEAPQDLGPWRPGLRGRRGGSFGPGRRGRRGERLEHAHGRTAAETPGGSGSRR